MMSTEEKKLFREKNLKKAADPEQLDQYLKATGVAPWLVILCAALVLAAVFIWLFFGKVETVIVGAGHCENGVITAYFAQNEMKDFWIGSVVDIDGHEGTVAEIGSELYLDQDIPYDILFLLPWSGVNWYSTVQVECGLKDGLYKIEYHTDGIAPISFLIERGAK